MWLSILATEEAANFHVPHYAVIIEHACTQMRRVVRSIMAAKAASLSNALDHQLCIRLPVENLLHGPAPIAREPPGPGHPGNGRKVCPRAPREDGFFAFGASHDA